MKMQGFSLFGFVLALVISMSALAVTVPALMRWGEQAEQQTRLVYVVDETMYAMVRKVAPHWSGSECKNVTVDLSIANLDLLELVEDLPWQLVPSYRNKQQFVVTIAIDTDVEREYIVNTFLRSEYLTEVDGNKVNIVMNVPMIESDYRHVNFNPVHECFETVHE